VTNSHRLSRFDQLLHHRAMVTRDTCTLKNFISAGEIYRLNTLGLIETCRKTQLLTMFSMRFQSIRHTIFKSSHFRDTGDEVRSTKGTPISISSGPGLNARLMDQINYYNKCTLVKRKGSDISSLEFIGN